VASELTFARGRIVTPGESLPDRWGPRLLSHSVHGLRLDRRRTTSTDQRVRGRGERDIVERGTWAIATLSRLPMKAWHTIDLGKLPTDPARRGAIVTDLELDGGAGPLRVVGTHLAHLSQGSPRHIAALRRALNALVPAPSVLAGDMNLWGPPLVLMLPGWSRAVRGRTWPTWSPRPGAQPDHILVRGPVHAQHGEVLRISGSDHLPIRATLVID
jgi:endonuclease/exonuclease/phosphatase family metal-dependent hydrolase